MAITIGVVGAGRMGRLYANLLMREMRTVHLGALIEPHLPAHESLARDFPSVRIVSDLQDVLSDLDAVVIASPTATHYELVMTAASAGKAIFCEKPLALTIPQTRAALAAVEQAAVPLQVGFMRRFDAAYARAAMMIQAGQIGTPLTFKAVGRDPFCPDPAFANPDLSGGLIIDMGIHDFDLARWLMRSAVERVSAEGTLLVCETLRPVGDIDNAVINLRFHGGAIGNVEVSRNACYGYDIRTEVLGSEGAVTIGAYQQTPVLLLTRSGAHHDVTPYLMERFGPAYQAQIQSFVADLLHDRSPQVGGAEALAAIEIGVAATRAAFLDRPVTIAEVRAEPD